MKIDVNGVELTVTQTKNSVTVTKVVARDRKRKLNITAGITTSLEKYEEAATLLSVLRRTAAMKTAGCTCDYRYGYSDHAEHCQSLYVAKYDRASIDDD